MKSLSAMVALLISVSASAGSLDGRGVICLSEGDSDRHFVWSKSDWIGYLFDDGEANHHIIYEDKEGVEVSSVSSADYRATAEKVVWEWGPYEHSAVYTLDRRTLYLSMGSRDGKVVRDWWCEVFATPQAFTAGIERVLKQENEARNAYMNKNKI